MVEMISIILIFIAIPLIISIFSKKEYAVEREVVINKPKQEVFDYVKFLKNQDNYSIWATMDPGMKKEYKGIDGTVGFISAWDSENKEVGKGEQEIMKISDGERLDFQLRFKVPFEATDDAYMTTEAVADNQTRVKWGFTGKMDYPMNFMLLFMDMEKMIGKDLETGLSNLKNILEKASVKLILKLNIQFIQSSNIQYLISTNPKAI
jgi:uncharacterized protein YndB with AHSA1/START domain